MAIANHCTSQVPSHEGQGIDLSFDNKSWRGWFAIIVTVGLAYFLAARLGLILRAKPGNVAVFWPAAGVAIGALIALGPKARVPVVAAVAIATIASKLILTGNPWLAVAFAIVCAGQTVLTPWLLEYWFGRAFKLDDVRQILGFVVASTAGAAFAALGVVALSASPPSRPPLSMCGASGSCRACWGRSRSPLSWLAWVQPARPADTPRADRGNGRPGDAGRPQRALDFAAARDLGHRLARRRRVSRPALDCGALPAGVRGRCGIRRSPDRSLVGNFSRRALRRREPPVSDRILAAQTLAMTGALIVLILAALFSERNRSEAALKMSNERLQLALSGASLGAFSVDVATGRLECDARAAFIHGHHTLPRTLLEGRRFVHPEDLRAVDAAFAEARRGEGVWSAEYRVIHPLGHPHAGETRWVAIEGSVLRNAEGVAVRSLGITHDITDRKLAERALVERNAQLALAGKAALVGSFAYDVGSGRMDVSAGYVAIHGLPEGTEETTRAEWRARVHPEDLPRLDASLRSDVDARRTEHHCDYRIVRSRGEVRWIEARSVISYDQNGDPLQLVGANIDVTERKNADLTLAERNMQLALAGKSALVGSFAYDADTEMMQISDGYAAIYGFPDGTTKIACSQWQRGVFPEDLLRWEKIRSRALRERREEYSWEYRIVRPGGDIRSIEARVFISYNGDGRPQRLVGVDIDVTERRRAEDHQRMLAAELDHRVKNVLAVVSAVAAQTRDASASMDHFVAAFHGRIQAMASTHELLSGRRWQGIPLKDLLRRQLAPYSTYDNTSIGGPEVLLLAEAGQALALVLHELTTNAAKHGALSTRAGLVTVRWRFAAASGRLIIEWLEAGRSASGAQGKPGYGTSVIRQLLPYELDGAVEFSITSKEVRCRIEIPAKWIAADRRINDNVRRPLIVQRPVQEQVE